MTCGAALFTINGDNIDDVPEHNGWRATWEYPGFVMFHHETITDRYVCATPDWGGTGIVAVEVTTYNGHNLDAFDVPWPAGVRSLASYMDIMRGCLDRIAAESLRP